MKQKTHEQFIEDVYNLVGNEYTVLGNYTKSSIKLKMKHNKCGHEYEVTPNKFLSLNRRCPLCFKNFRKTQKQFEKEVFEKFGEEYTIIGTYVNNKSPVEIKHNKCNHTFSALPKEFLFKESRCPYCSKIKFRSHEQYVEEVYELVGDEYTVLGTYEGTKIPIEMKHNTCGHIYKVRPRNFLYTGNHCSNRCPICNKPLLNRVSMGEEKINSHLEKLGLDYEREYRFDGCRSDKDSKLPFDFVVFSENEEPLLAIEFDGKQHFIATGIIKEWKVKRIQFLDNIKNQFCKDINLKLLRINYKEINDIENIINEFLKTHKIIC